MSEKREDGGAAFPMVVTEYNTESCERETTSIGGITVRDYFAAKAMHAFIASNHEGAAGHSGKAAQWAYEQADAMLEARKK